ncbi:MAG: hypothetical protein COB67_00270 [SAR324 cluster bacterium]|uniref:TraD/TraG TraM recognition site domain-containing protein n=1 Tax=SAR324 cluster bacterium TaxID=2024889 RepID=A0A2A4TC29_9DELT|nr:MAG: hypothetical protein COB67_00270 [SAR324 cluster bacterium]
MLDILNIHHLMWKRNKKKYLKNHKKVVAAEDKLEALETRMAPTKKIESAKTNLMKYLVIRAGIEERLIDIKRGLYIGFGIDLDNKSNGMQPIYLDWGKLENHDDTIGTTQYGKTYKLGSDVAQCIAKKENLFIVDPKGGKKREILGWTIDALAKTGIPEWLAYINPLFPELSLCVNPIFGMANEEIASTASLLSQGGGAQMSGDANFYGPFAYKVVLASLTALEYLEAVTSTKEDVLSEIKEEVRKYVENEQLRGMDKVSEDTLNELILPDVSERLVFTSEVNKKETLAHSPVNFKRTLITFKELANFSQFHNLEKLREALLLYDVPEGAKGYYSLMELRNESLALLDEIVLKDAKFYEKVATSLSTLFVQLSTGSIGKVLCTTRINPIVARLYDKEKGLVCVIEPVPMKFRQVSDVLLKVFMKMLESVFGSVGVSGRELPRRTHFFIDEGKAAIFPGIEEIYNKAASAGLSIHTYYQSTLDRVSKLGPVDAGVVGDNVNTLYIMKPNDKNSAAFLAETLGTENRLTSNFMSDSGSAGGRFSAMAEQKAMITPSTLDVLRKGEAFVKHYGKRYRVYFPFMLPPKANILMPELNEERTIKEILAYEKEIQENLGLYRISITEKKRNIENDKGKEYV